MTKTLFFFDGELGEFLLAMAAVRDYARVSKSEVHVVVSKEELLPLLKNAWFCKDVSVGTFGGVDSYDYDYVSVLELDKNEADTIELSSRKKQKAMIDAEISKIAKANNIEEDMVQKPPHYAILESDKPSWHKITAYGQVISNDTGAKVDPELLPYFPSIVGIADRTRSFLHANRKVLNPGKPFVLVQNAQYFEDRGVDVIYPGSWGCINTEYVDYSLLVGLISSKRCAATIGPVGGGATYLGWAANVDLVLEAVGDDTDGRWELSRAENAVAFNIDNKTVAANMPQNLRYVYKLKLGVDIA